MPCQLQLPVAGRNRQDWMDLDKENRPPRDMALVGKSKGGNRTPNRTRNRTQQFFEPGKVGRKTGITLKDTGIRDEHGLEPVSGIFSSPPTGSPGGTLGSCDMRMQESEHLVQSPWIVGRDLTTKSGTAPEATEVLKSCRRTPRLPPPRSATPKHTNIGSPKRMSSAFQRQPANIDSDGIESPRQILDDIPPNRKLDFGAHKGAASPSPFKPKKTLRRSTLAVRPDPFTIADDLPEPDPAPESVGLTTPDKLSSASEIIQGPRSDLPLLEPHDDGPLPSDAGPADGTISLVNDSPSQLKRVDSGLRKTSVTETEVETPRTVKSSGRKRDSTALKECDEDVSMSIETEDITRPIKRSRRSEHSSMLRYDEARDEADDAEGHITIDPSILGTEEQPLMLDDGEESAGSGGDGAEPTPLPEPEPRTQGHNKARKDKKSGRTAKSRARICSPANSPSKARATSTGPVSNVHLRSTTPFEDAEGRRSRYGRTLTQPLKYWANETRIWKEGEIEGIVRADEVINPGNANGKKNKKRRRGMTSKLEDIEEEVVNDSVLPDDWEEELGVISGLVARWNPAAENGDQQQDLVQEDLAFAATSIVTRDVLDGDFRYAKIVTMPFFGCGVVQVPPNGYKRSKSSKKMHMVFFVHEGKVLVEIGKQDMEVNQFNISKGGVWVVPRGNFYAISNESQTTPAYIFFAQGCEMDTPANADKAG